MSEETKVESQETEQSAPNLATVLSAFPSAPTQEKIDEWKVKYGEVFVSGFSDDELYIWRPLRRKEYVEYNKTPPSDGQQLTEYDFQEWVVNACLLWASDRSCLDRKAGAFSSISDQVMLNSNFVAPAMSAALVMKL